MKHIVSLIKKMAQGKEKSPLDGLPAGPGEASPPPAQPATTPAAPAAKGWTPPWEKPGKGVTPGGKPVVVKNPDVVTMQQAIIDFANIASSSDVTSMTGNKEGRQEGDQTRLGPLDLPVSRNLDAPEDAEKRKHLGGSDAFSNFIIQNHFPKDGLGKQYLNTDVAGTDKREFTTTSPENLRGIIDSIKRIGSPTAIGERVPDGQWGTRTNNSLHLIGDLIQSMLSFTKHMKIAVPGYTEQNLQEFKSKVPTDYKNLKTQEDFSKAAKEIVPHLRAMTEYFRYLNGKVFNNQQLRKYIDQQRSFTKYDSVKIPEGMGERKIPGVQFDWIKDPKLNGISLNDLSSLNNFKAFLKRVVQIPATGDQSKMLENPDIVKKYLDVVNQTINQTATTRKS